MKLLRSMHKQLRVLLHHRLTTAVIILGPIFLLLAASVAFSSDGLHGIKVGWVGSQEGGFEQGFSEGIESAGYRLIPFASSTDCEDSLKRSQVHMCVSVDAEQQTVRFHVDASRINLVWTLLNTVQQTISNTQENYRYELTTSLLSSVSRLSEGMRVASGSLDNLSTSLDAVALEIDRLEREAAVSLPSPSQPEFPASAVDGREFLALIDENQRAVDDAQATLRDAERDLMSQDEEFAEQEQELQNTFEENGCSEETAIDYREQQPADWDSQVQDENQFICNVLYTQLQAMRACRAPLAQMDSHIDSFDDQLDETEESLADAETRAGEMIAAGEQQEAQLRQTATTVAQEQDAALATLRERQQRLRASLRELSAFMENGSSQVAAVDDSLRSLSADTMRVGNRSADDFVYPVVVSTRGLDSDREPIDYLFGPFLLFIAMFVSILLGAVLVVRERSARGFQRLLVSPSSPYLVLVSTFFTTLLVSFVQVSVLAFTGSFLGLSVDISLSVLFILFLACVVFVLIGMLLGVLLPTVETAITITILAGLSMLFFSNTLVPIESIPLYLQQIAQFNPLLFFSQALSRGLLHDISVLGMLVEVLLAVGTIAVLCMSLWASFSLVIKRVLRS